MSASNPFSVEGMVVVITGGATGIGLAMTKAFALNGAAKVYIVGRRKEKLEEAAKASPKNIIPIVGDVTSKESLIDVAAQVEKDIGYVNLVIANSGVMPPDVGAKVGEASLQEFAKAALALDFDEYTNTFATNSVSVLFTAFAFLELLGAGNEKGNCADRKSQILVTSSIAGYLRMPGGNLAYGASKAAATHIVKHLASTLANYDIRVNALAPGLFASDLASSLITRNVGKDKDPTQEGALPKPIGRIGRESEMAGTVQYLASAAAAYLNGNITVIDGGRLSQAPSTY